MKLLNDAGQAFTRAKQAMQERVFENPATPLSDPASWLLKMFGGPTESGVSVTEESAMRMSTVGACISLVSETVAQLPLNMYERKSDKEKAIVREHPIHYLLHNQPNDLMTSFSWRESMQSHAMGWGNNYSVIARAGDRPVALMPLLPDRTRPTLSNGRLKYETILPDGTLAHFDMRDMLHVPAFSSNGLVGVSPVRKYAETIGLAMAAQNFGARFYANGTHLGGVLTTDQVVDPDEAKAAGQRFKESFSGSDNSHKVAVLGNGLKLEKIGIAPNDAQFLETRKFQRTEICGIYKVPPHMVGDLDKSAFSNITEQSIQYVRYAVVPWLTRWEQELNRKLFPDPSDRMRFYVKFELAALLRGTPKERAEFYHYGIHDGWLNRNKARDFEDLNPEEGLDEYLVPLNMTGSDGLIVDDDGSQDNGTADDRSLAPRRTVAARTALTDVQIFAPLIERFAAQLVNADEKVALRGASNDTLDASIARWSVDCCAFAERHLEPLQKTMSAAGLPASGLVAAVVDYVQPRRTITSEGAEALPVIKVSDIEQVIYKWVSENHES